MIEANVILRYNIYEHCAICPDCFLANLYNEVTMPPELRKTHHQNDKTVIEAYGMSVRETTEASCNAELMRQCQALRKQRKRAKYQ